MISPRSSYAVFCLARPRAIEEAEHVESQSAETVLTPDECQLLGYLDKGKRKRKEKAGSLQWAYMAIARLGGFMDSKRTGIASWGALW